MTFRTKAVDVNRSDVTVMATQRQAADLYVMARLVWRKKRIALRILTSNLLHVWSRFLYYIFRVLVSVQIGPRLPWRWYAIKYSG